jgi:DNA-binding MarR family transcriptional regulator
MSTSRTAKRARLGKADFERLSRFRHRLRRFLRFSEELCRDWGLTSLQYQLLLHVMGFPGRDWATISELADCLQAHHHGVVALIDRCEKLDLLERRPGRADQRVVEIHLLPKGEKLLASVAARHQDELALLMREFSDTVEAVAQLRRAVPALRERAPARRREAEAGARPAERSGAAPSPKARKSR